MLTKLSVCAAVIAQLVYLRPYFDSTDQTCVYSYIASYVGTFH